MKEFFKSTRQIAAKDLRIEWKTKEITYSTALFATLVVIMASLSFYLTPALARQIAPGVLWIAITFGGLLAVGRGWARERDGDAMRALLLSPAPRASIYFGKLLSNLVFLLIVEVIITPMVALFFHIDLWAVLGPLALILVLGTLGFVAAATLFGAMTVRTGARDLALSVVVFPLITPALLASVVATKQLFGGAELGDTVVWLRILLAFDVFFIAAGMALFEPLMSD